MPFQCEFQRAADLFQIEIEGRISETEIDSLIEQVHNEPAFHLTRKQIILVRDSQNSVTLGLLKELLVVDSLTEEKKIAVVIEDEKDYRLLQTDQLTRKELPPQIQLFSLRLEANRWLAGS